MKVALYIYTESLENATDYTIGLLKSRAEAFEAESCLAETFADGLFGNYTTAKRIELFDDEKISVTSSIQNINDISKVFTDYSQSFTIPASDNNNSIFKHWYENSIENGYDQRIKSDGFIEIDTQIFRVGKWQLESASVIDNQIQNYKITFYGVLKSLLDQFGEDKLNNIETLNDYTVEYSGDIVQSRVLDGIDYDIMFPLITSGRVWEYGTGGTLDIRNPLGSIVYDELFPAIKVARVFDAIATKYGLTFNGSFLTQDKFTKAYLWLKNGEATNLTPTTEPQRLNFTTNHFDDYIQVDAATDTVTALSFPNSYLYQNGRFNLVLTFPSSVNATLYVYKDGTLYTTVAQSGTSLGFTINESLGLGAYTFEIQTNVATTYTFSYEELVFEYDPYGVSSDVVFYSGTGSGTLSSNLDLTIYTPDMKVSDFFSGILKMFNLTAFSEDGINFTLEQLENWYYQGQIEDFSEYCLTDFEYNRIKPYKKIEFKYEKSESIINRKFNELFGREYGDLDYSFPYDGSDYNIKLPFEDLQFSKFDSTDLQVGYALKPDLNPYAPKPIILYFTGLYSGDLYFDNGTAPDVNLGQFSIFGQDLINGLQPSDSLNWGVEISSFLLSPVNNSLFNNYYLSYLSNLYAQKSRMVKVKMRLPYNKLLALKLNDRIVIRDKRYIINQYTTDLTTFESDFELIQDFRTLEFSNGGLKIASVSNQTLRFFTTSNSIIEWVIQDDPNGQIITIDSQEGYVDVEIKENYTAGTLYYSIESNKGDVIIIQQNA